MSIDQILRERETQYGKFINHATIAQILKTTIFSVKSIRNFSSPDQVEALEMICHKIARILNGDHNYIDSWTDIAGYATLVADRLTADKLTAGATVATPVPEENK